MRNELFAKQDAFDSYNGDVPTSEIGVFWYDYNALNAHICTHLGHLNNDSFVKVIPIYKQIEQITLNTFTTLQKQTCYKTTNKDIKELVQMMHMTLLYDMIPLLKIDKTADTIDKIVYLKEEIENNSTSRDVKNKIIETIKTRILTFQERASMRNIDTKTLYTYGSYVFLHTDVIENIAYLLCSTDTTILKNKAYIINNTKQIAYNYYGMVI